jgi:L-rhamnose-H+ transport protein
MLSAILLITIAGLVIGGGGWPMKLMRTMKYEQFGFITCLIALIIIPWAATLIGCPDAFGAYREVWRHDPSIIIKSNIFSFAWGIANVLCWLCFVRIGFALTNCILPVLGVSIGTTLPMIFKGTGIFGKSPDIASPAGMAVMAAVGVIIAGVIFASLAGFGRERAHKESGTTPGGGLEHHHGFASGLMMAIAAGVLSAGLAFSFVYSQGPIVAAMKSRGAGDFAANYSVWAVGIFSGALLNVIYPAYLMTMHRTWGVLMKAPRDLVLCVIMGAHAPLALPLMGLGMLKLGPLGASVGFGIQQATQMIGGQLVGFISGEWHGVKGTPRRQMYTAIACLLIAIVILSYGNALAKR